MFRHEIAMLAKDLKENLRLSLTMIYCILLGYRKKSWGRRVETLGTASSDLYLQQQIDQNCLNAELMPGTSRHLKLNVKDRGRPAETISLSIKLA